jgi:hypothetical protein
MHKNNKNIFIFNFYSLYFFLSEYKKVTNKIALYARFLSEKINFAQEFVNIIS